METGTAGAAVVDVLVGGAEETVGEAELRAERKRRERVEESRSARIKPQAAARHRLQWCSICHEDQRHLVVLNFSWTEVAVCGACLVEARRKVTQQLGLRVQLP
jgi:hypothetical protein